ncbi:hypothetical protein [Amycolatopsis sp. NPDC051372]|uniref:hypothetical protein n=1 Tax=Amycolatopsis sp. NPDC051372 TaxID=3155669 RepID=UPI00343D14E8
MPAEHEPAEPDADTLPEAIAVDGKSLRGTFARTGGAGVHLLAAMTHYVFTVKENQHRLHGLLQTLPWHEIPAHIITDCGHGRT